MGFHIILQIMQSRCTGYGYWYLFWYWDHPYWYLYTEFAAECRHKYCIDF